MIERMDHNPPMSIPEQAAEWLLRWHCGDLSIAQRFEYLQWLKTSPVHIAETLRMCRLYSWLEATKLRVFITNEDSFANVVTLSLSEMPPEMERADTFEAEVARAVRAYPVDTETLVRNALDELAQQPLWRRSTREFMTSRVAAIAAAAVAAVVVLSSLWLIHGPAPVEGVATRAGEWRELPLEDGTEVVLGPHSHVRREYDEVHRTVLLDSGEVLFKVAKDRRPFLVRARGVSAQALGTEFGMSLTRSDGPVTVTVQEGRVAVSLEDRPGEVISVAAGEQLTVVDSDSPAAPRRIDATRELAWARKRLEFEAGDGDTVGSAVQEFNRRNTIQIEIDSTLAGRAVGGEFDASDPMTFAHAVVEQGDVVLSRSANTVRLEVKEHPPDELAQGARNER